MGKGDWQVEGSGIGSSKILKLSPTLANNFFLSFGSGSMENGPGPWWKITNAKIMEKTLIRDTCKFVSLLQCVLLLFFVCVVLVPIIPVFLNEMDQSNSGIKINRTSDDGSKIYAYHLCILSYLPIL